MSKFIDHKKLAWLITSQNNDFFTARDATKFLFQGSRAVKDNDVLDYIYNDCIGEMYKINAHQQSFLKEFENKFLPWINNHSSNSILGLDNYKPNFSNGTTQAFDSFYLRHSNRQFRCFVGEYFYHIKSWLSISFKWDFINSIEDLRSNDAVIISAPFCDTGDVHKNYYELLSHCEKENIPVLVDCCYYPISGNIRLDLDYRCIDTVCFSLSKTFPVAKYRIGIRYVRKNIEDGQSLLSDIDYNNNFAAYIGLKLMEKYSSDYIFTKYRKKQEDICNKLPGLSITSSAIFAIGDKSWNSYNRKNLLDQYKLKFAPELFVNRICLSSIYENWSIYKEYASTTKV